jgi:hypothetical protein
VLSVCQLHNEINYVFESEYLAKSKGTIYLFLSDLGFILMLHYLMLFLNSTVLGEEPILFYNNSILQ